MKRRPPLARISITLPHPQLDAADRIAAQLDRSRSWVLSEAIRRWVEPTTGPDQASAAAPIGRVPAPDPVPAPGFAPAAALRLSAAARLRAAQDLVGEFRRAHPRSPRLQIIAFGSLQDFQAWQAGQ